MPVERRTASRQLVGVAVAVLAVVLAGAAAWGLISLAGGKGSGVTVRLGDDVFDAGQATRLARQVRRDGPVLFSDVSGRGQRRPLFVNHFGDDVRTRWVAFTAVAPGADEGCFLAWSARRSLFEERRLPTADGRRQGALCRPVTFASNGQGLEQFPWRIDAGGNLLVDLRPPTTSTTTPS